MASEKVLNYVTKQTNYFMPVYTLYTLHTLLFTLKKKLIAVLILFPCSSFHVAGLIPGKNGGSELEGGLAEIDDESTTSGDAKESDGESSGNQDLNNVFRIPATGVKQSDASNSTDGTHSNEHTIRAPSANTLQLELVG